MREALEAQLHAGNIEVNIVGDFKAEELDDLLVKYLGTIRPVSNPPSKAEDSIGIRFPEKDIRQQVWHLKDSDERAAAYVAGIACPPMSSYLRPVSADIHKPVGPFAFLLNLFSA